MSKKTKGLVILLLFLLIVGMGVIFATQPALANNAKETITLLEVFDDWLDYEFEDMKNLITSLDYKFISTTLSYFVLPTSILSLIFVSISLKKNSFKVLSIIFSMLSLIASGAGIYFLVMLSQGGIFTVLPFGYVYYGLAIFSSFVTFLFVKNK